MKLKIYLQLQKLVTLFKFLYQSLEENIIIVLMLIGNSIMETIFGIYGVIGDYVTPLITTGIIIGIAHMGIKSGLIINLRQGSYQDLKFHKNQEYK